MLVLVGNLSIVCTDFFNSFHLYDPRQVAAVLLEVGLEQLVSPMGLF
jgi:hypothetical protein